MATLTTPVSTFSFSYTTTPILVANQVQGSGVIKNAVTFNFNQINMILIAKSPSGNTTQVGVWF